MSRNGSGTYTLPAGNPVVTGTTISSTWANNTLSDIASALTGSIASDGQTTPTANLPMGGYNHTNVANATARTQYATAGQVEDGTLNYLTSVSGTNAITATAPVSMSAYVAGQTFRFIAAGANTGAVTLNLNAIGAKSVVKTDGSALVSGDIASGGAVQVIYDGTNFQLLSDSNGASETVTTLTATTKVVTPQVGSSSGSFTIQSANTTAMTVDSSQNVGIGTSSPGGYRLNVQGGDAYFGNPVYARSNNYFGATNASVSIQHYTNADWNYSGLNLWRNASNTSTPRFLGMPLDGDSDSNTTIGGYNAIWGAYDSSPTTGSTSSALNGKMVYGAYAGHQWYTNGSERMRIDSSGNVGIGTSSPSTLLHLSQNGNTTAFISATNSGTNSAGITLENAGQRNWQVWADRSTDTFRIGNNSRATTNITLDSTGNVGIGTSSPANRADIYDASAKAALLAHGYSVIGANADTNNGCIQVGANGSAALQLDYDAATGGTGTASIYNTYSGALRFGTNNTERMRIDYNGNFCVGTTGFTGAAGFSVAPNYSNGSATAVFNRANTASTSYAFYFQNNASTVGSISYTNSATAYTTSSDYRLKENIAPMTGALETVAQLKPVTYTWKVDGSNGQGFIAHELQEIVPDAVIGEKDATEEQEYEITPAIPAVLDEEGNVVEEAVPAVMGTRTVPVYQGIDTSFLVATLTAALQESHALIKDLQNRVTALEAK